MAARIDWKMIGENKKLADRVRKIDQNRMLFISGKIFLEAKDLEPSVMWNSIPEPTT